MKTQNGGCFCGGSITPASPSNCEYLSDSSCILTKWLTDWPSVYSTRCAPMSPTADSCRTFSFLFRFSRNWIKHTTPGRSSFAQQFETERAAVKCGMHRCNACTGAKRESIRLYNEQEKQHQQQQKRKQITNSTNKADVQAKLERQRHRL